MLAGKIYSVLLQIVQIGCKAHRPSYLMGTGGGVSGVKRPGREADHSSASSGEIKNEWSYTATPPYVFMAWRTYLPFYLLTYLFKDVYLQRMKQQDGSRSESFGIIIPLCLLIDIRFGIIIPLCLLIDIRFYYQNKHNTLKYLWCCVRSDNKNGCRSKRFFSFQIDSDN
jgi:hypothetical protein